MGFNVIGGLFGLGGSSGSAAALAQKQNRKQQWLIDQGTQSINSMFGGGMTSPTYNKAIQPVAGGQYFVQHGAGYKAFNGPSSSLSAKAKSGQLFTQTPGTYQQGYTPDFFQNRANAYDQFAMPQLGQQYDQAQRALQYGMADRGLGVSSASNQQSSDLNRQYGIAQQNVLDTGQNQANQLKSSLEQARETALGQLYQTANPGQAGQTALNLASQVTAPSLFAPVGNAFSNILSQIALKQAYNNTPQLGYYAPVSNFNANSGALPTNTGGQ